VLLGDVLDAVARIFRAAVRRGNEVADFIGARRGRPYHSGDEIDGLADVELVHHVESFWLRAIAAVAKCASRTINAAMKRPFAVINFPKASETTKYEAE
jgi:hypothetical protein